MALAKPRPGFFAFITPEIDLSAGTSVVTLLKQRCFRQTRPELLQFIRGKIPALSLDGEPELQVLRLSSGHYLIQARHVLVTGVCEPNRC